VKSKLMKNRIIILLVTTIFFIIFWILTNLFKFEAIKIIGIDASLPMFNGDSGAYTSVMAYNVIYISYLLYFFYIIYF
jgi:glucose uptake protein GlcU